LDDVVGVFTIAIAPQLASILNKDTQGTWTLVVDDMQTQDKGRLLDSHWSLAFAARVPDRKGTTLVPLPFAGE
jgi:subtilisin-like proprotein convertase family protein